MRLFAKVAAILCCVMFSVLVVPLKTAVAGEKVGVRQMTVFSKERNTEIAVTVWYPSMAGGKLVTLGESPFFVGTPALLDAPASKHRYPLILLSHGAGIAGSAQAVSWIAAPLAERGFIVAAPTHPGNGGVSRSAAETMKLWLRPNDVTETLNTLDKDEVLKDYIQPQQVGMLGLSMGGNTALAIAGARIDPARLAHYCDDNTLNASLCDWVTRSGVDLHAMDMTLAGRDNRDSRIKFVMAIDPAPMDIFAPSSFAMISLPVDLVNLGKLSKIPKTVRADKAAQSIPNASYSTIEDASHYSMFADCKPGIVGSSAEREIGDPICSDGGGRSREDIHDQLINMAEVAFKQALKQKQ